MNLSLPPVSFKQCCSELPLKKQLIMEGSRRITHINFVFFSEGQCVNNSMAAG